MTGITDEYLDHYQTAADFPSLLEQAKRESLEAYAEFGPQTAGEVFQRSFFDAIDAAGKQSLKTSSLDSMLRRPRLENPEIFGAHINIVIEYLLNRST